MAGRSGAPSAGGNQWSPPDEFGASTAGLHVTGVCASLAEAEALMHAHLPRLLVLDVEPGGEPYRDAADLLLRLRPEAELMFVTALAAEFTPPADLAPFTVGVVDKADAWDRLLDVMLAWKRKRQEEVAAYMPSCGQLLEAIERLSPREQRLLRELGCGLLNKEIAARLELTCPPWRPTAKAWLPSSA